MLKPPALNIPYLSSVTPADQWGRYLCALIATAVASAGTFLIWPLIDPAVSLLFFIAVLFSAWHGGLRPSLLCSVLSTVACNWFYVVPRFQLEIGADDLLRFTVFMLASVFVSSLTLARQQAEEIAERTQKQLATTIKSIGDAVLTIDHHGRITSMNSVAQSLTGWTESEARGKTLPAIYTLLEVETRESVEGISARAIRDNVAIALGSSVLLVTRDGCELPVNEIATPLRGPNGEITGVVLVLRNAFHSVEKPVEDVLAESLTMLQSMGAPMCALDPAGACLTITNGALALLDYRREQIVGVDLHELLHSPHGQDSCENDCAVLTHFVGDNTSANIIDTIHRRDGSLIPAALAVTPLLVGDRAFGRIVSITDLTETYKAQEAALKLQAVVNSMEEAVIAHTTDGEITDWNHGAEQLYGYKRDEVIGRSVSIIHPPGREAELTELFQKLARKERVAPFESLRIGKGGEQIEVSIRTAPLIDPTGTVIGICQVVSNIRRNNQTQAAEQLQPANSRISDMAFVRSAAGLSRKGFVDTESRSIRPVRQAQAEMSRSQSPDPVIIVGQSPAIKSVLSTISRIARTDSSVLITGATGTGKELIARAIHQQSLRSKGPFVDINCSAMPETLIEAELFGHQKGTFTGAHEHRPGLFEIAAGGTLFLDEIDALNLSAQAKLLRVIQERRVRRIGGRVNIDVDVRIISATNSDLSMAISDNRFRADLYYRLRVVPLRIPELYQRDGDVELLIEHFLKRHTDSGRGLRRFSTEAKKALLEYPWPGNVRELENAIEYALAMSSEEVIPLDALPPELSIDNVRQDASDLKKVEAYLNDSVPLAEIEKRYILSVLRQFGGNQVKTAAALGIDRSKLYRRLKQYGIMAVKFIQDEDQEGLQFRSTKTP